MNQIMTDTKKKLYPFEFIPAEFDKSWGKEVWTAADMGFVDSEISKGWLSGNSMSDLMETYLERVVGEDVYQYYGRQFPVFVRFVDVDGRTPLMVHPGDEVAMERYDVLGKAQLVYVTEAEENAVLYLGFCREVSASEFYERCMDGNVMELLNAVKPKKGDFYIIEPGQVHAAAGKMKFVCVSESSDADFIMYDPSDAVVDKELRTMHISEAMDFINFAKYASGCHCGCGHDHDHEHHHNEHHSDEKIVDTLAERPEFNITRLNLTDPLHIYTEKFGSFILYVCVEGELSVQVPSESSDGGKGMENYVIGKGESVLIPADMPDFFLVPRDCQTILLEVVTKPAEMLDEYIDPNTEPYLEGEDYGLDDDDLDDDLEEGLGDNQDDNLDAGSGKFGISDTDFPCESGKGCC